MDNRVIAISVRIDGIEARTVDQLNTRIRSIRTQLLTLTTSGRGASVEANRLRSSLIGLSRESNRLNLKRQASNTRGLSDSYRDLNSQLNRAIESYRNLDSARRKSSEGRQLLSDIGGLQGETNAIDAQIASARGRTSGSGLGTAAAIAGVTAALTSAVTVAADFSRQISFVGAVSGATEEQLESLRKQALDLGGVTEFTASQVAQLEIEFSKLGFTASQIGSILEPTVNLATVAQESLGRTAEVVGVTIRAFNLDVEDTGRVVDVLSKSFSSSALDLSRFDVGVGVVGAVASATGRSLEEVTAQLGVLSNAGFEASIGATALRNIFLVLQKEGLELNDVLATIRNAGEDGITVAEQLFGRRGAAQAVALARNTADFNRIFGELTNSGGFADQAAKKIREDLKGSFEALISSLERLRIVFADLFADELSSFVRGITSFITTIADAVESTVEFKNSIGVLGSALVSVVGLFGGFKILQGSLGALSRGFSFFGVNVAATSGGLRVLFTSLTRLHPVVAVVTTVIGALIGVLVRLQSTRGVITDWVNNSSLLFERFAKNATASFSTLQTIVKNISDDTFGSSFTNAVGNAMGFVADSVSNGVDIALNKFTELKNAAATALDNAAIQSDVFVLDTLGVGSGDNKAIVDAVTERDLFSLNLFKNEYEKVLSDINLQLEDFRADSLTGGITPQVQADIDRLEDEASKVEGVLEFIGNKIDTVFSADVSKVEIVSKDQISQAEQLGTELDLLEKAKKKAVINKEDANALVAYTERQKDLNNQLVDSVVKATQYRDILTTLQEGTEEYNDVLEQANKNDESRSTILSELEKNTRTINEVNRDLAQILAEVSLSTSSETLADLSKSISEIQKLQKLTADQEIQKTLADQLKILIAQRDEQQKILDLTNETDDQRNARLTEQRLIDVDIRENRALSDNQGTFPDLGTELEANEAALTAFTERSLEIEKRFALERLNIRIESVDERIQKEKERIAEATGLELDQVVLANQSLIAEKAKLEKEKLDIELDSLNKSAEAETEALEKSLEKRKEFLDALEDAFKTVLRQLGDLNDTLDIRSEERIKNVERRAERETDLAQGNALAITEIERRKNLQIEAIQKAQFEREKRLSILQTIVDGAQSIIKITSQTGIFAPPLIAIQAALTAFQVATIASQTFAQGGFTGKSNARRDRTGHRPVGTVHEDEYVVPKKVLFSPEGRSLVNQLESMRIGKGYRAPSDGLYMEGGFTAVPNTSSLDTVLVVNNKVTLDEEDILKMATIIADKNEKATERAILVANEASNRVRVREERLNSRR